MRWIFALFAALGINLLLFLGMQLMVSPAEKPIQRLEAQIIDYIKVDRQVPNQSQLQPAQPEPPPPPLQKAIARTATPEINALSQPPIDIKPIKLDMDAPKISQAKPYLGAVEKKPLPKPKKKTPPPKVVKTVPEQPKIVEQKVVKPAPIKAPSTPKVAASSAIDFVPSRDLVILKRTKPRYPRSLKRRRIEGYVFLEFIINRAGKVEQPKILESKPSGAFDKSVLKAIRGWKFQPKMQNGKAVKVKTRQRVEFKLRR